MRTRLLLIITLATVAAAAHLRAQAQAVATPTPTAAPVVYTSSDPVVVPTPTLSPSPSPMPSAPPDDTAEQPAPTPVPGREIPAGGAATTSTGVGVPAATSPATTTNAVASTTPMPTAPPDAGTSPSDVTAVAAPTPTPVAGAVTPAANGALAVTPSADGDGHATITAKPANQPGKDTLSVDFPDEDIRNILRNVADLFELNLVIPETLQGKATVKLRDVTWRQIFTVVLTPVGYSYVEDGNIIKIVSNDSLQQEPTSTEVFTFNYARAADILPTLQTLVDTAAGGRIVVDSRSNSLVVTERPSRMNRIRPIIEILDRATDQVMIETKFIEVTASDVKNVGVNWSSLGGYNVGLTPSGTNTVTATNTISNGYNNTGGTTGSNTTTNTSLSGTNSTGSQGTTSTNSSNVTSTNGAAGTVGQTGTTGTVASNNGTNASTTVNNTIANAATSALQNLATLATGSASTRTISALFSADQFSLVLSALQTLQSTKIVSNPTVVTLNNTEATISVSTERPIPNYTYNEQRGSFEVSGFVYKPIGVILKVTPQVNARGYIKLVVEPEVSQSSRNETFNGANIPIVDSRKAKTQVSLKDGYTMGIGGLITNTASGGTSKVPVLGSLPVLGRLFRSDNKNVQSTNLLIFITAKALPAEGAAVEDVFDPRLIKGMNIQRNELPGFRDGSDPFTPGAPMGASGSKNPPRMGTPVATASESAR